MNYRHPAYRLAADASFTEHYGRLHKLFVGEHQPVFYGSRLPKNPYFVANWLGGVVSPTWARLLFGQFPEVVAPMDTPDEVKGAVSALVEELDLAPFCLASALAASWGGEAVWKLTFSTATQRLVRQLVDGRDVTWVFAPDNPSVPIGASFWWEQVRLTRDGKVEERFVLEERQYLSSITPSGVHAGTVRIPLRERSAGRTLTMEYHAYNASGMEVPLTAPFTAAEQERGMVPDPPVQILPIDALTLIYIPNRVSQSGWRGESDYTKTLKEVQRAINERFSLDQHVLNLHSQPTLIIPESLAPGGMVNVKDLEWVLDDSSGNMKPQYIEWSGELGASERMKDWSWSQLMRLAGFSTSVFGEGRGDSGKARELELIATVAEVRARRLIWESALRQLLYLSMRLEQINGISSAEPIRDISVNWAPVLPEDRLETAQMVNVLYSGGLMSLDQALHVIHPSWSQEEIDEEIDRLETQKDAQQARTGGGLAALLGGAAA